MESIISERLAIPPISGPSEDFLLISESWKDGKYVRVGKNKKGDYKIQYCELNLVDGCVQHSSSYIPANLAIGVIRLLVSDLLSELEIKDAG